MKRSNKVHVHVQLREEEQEIRAYSHVVGIGDAPRRWVGMIPAKVKKDSPDLYRKWVSVMNEACLRATENWAEKMRLQLLFIPAEV